MKGLLVKDFRLVLQNNRMFAILGIVAVIFYASQGAEASGFVISYVTMLCGMLVLSTISTDEFDNSILFLMTLPVTKKTYALEKYVFTFCISFAGWFVATAVSLLITNGERGELFLISIVIFAVLLLFFMLLLPIQLKYGGEKGRMVLLIIVALIMLAGFGIKELGKRIFDSQEEALGWMMKMVD